MSTNNFHRPDAPIRIVPYDATWPALFAAERLILERVLDEWLIGPVEHIGSTAVPELVAKPVIDIMAGVESLGESRPAIPRLATIGYLYFPYKPEQKHWFCKPSPAFRTHHLHLIPFGSKEWNDQLAFRNYLRRDSAAAGEYAELKRRLAKQYEFDREAYTEAKGPFIQGILRLAL
jgi:GrpB-like predicted nucleotidyltransferase (UPF0157 family)